MFIICETFETDEKLHLAPPDVAHTLCGREIANRTLIPIKCWGNPDRTWCTTCCARRISRIRERAKEEAAHAS